MSEAHTYPVLARVGGYFGRKKQEINSQICVSVGLGIEPRAFVFETVFLCIALAAQELTL